MNFPENAEAATIAQKKAKEEYPDDLSMQEYIYDGQMHDHAELRELLSGGALDSRLRSAAAKIASENANDFSMHLYCLNEQREALQKLDALAPQINNSDALKRAFSRVVGENPDDFSMQHYEMEQQLEAKRKLDALAPQINGRDTLKLAFARVITEYPDDFNMQHYEMGLQLDSMKKLEALSPVIKRGSALQHALSSAKSEYPDDFSMQHYELEGLMQRAGAPDHLGSDITKGDCMNTRIGQLETLYSARGIPSHRIELWHDGLNKHRLIKGSESGVVRHKARLQADEWDKKWAGVYTRENDRQIRQTGKTTAAIALNGYVTSIDRGTGQQVTACVLSIHARRDEFMALNLASIEPKTCFKRLKGVGSAKLYGLVPVPPIMQLPREDARFVSSYAVADTLDSSSNLAAMDWEDFEHLIREVFEKEFLSSGGEVKVTQASRDGGVDAIAFDPDPIRGGKIVIQAKRYTNTVGVSAVRDLYGTVMNEGANKGILVTTSDFGPDSYAFAQGKPLVLLTGGNLLHLLQKHGHKARIDINEARKLAAASNS